MKVTFTVNNERTRLILAVTAEEVFQREFYAKVSYFFPVKGEIRNPFTIYSNWTSDEIYHEKDFQIGYDTIKVRCVLFLRNPQYVCVFDKVLWLEH